MKTKIKWSLLVVFATLLGWYFLIKESDYIITFSVKTSTGTVFQGIEDWSNNQYKSKNENYTTLEKRNFDYIKQKMTQGQNYFEYIWTLDSENDSVTKVSIGIKDVNHSFYNRLTAPFLATNFRTEQIEKIKSFKLGLENHLNNFKIKIDGIKSTSEIYVAYISLNSVMQEKAQTMIANDAEILGYLVRNKIKILGYRPYLEITEWNQDKETVSFNYCFPISKNTKYVQDDKIKFKTIPAMKGIQATYFGNYRTSDRAWFALLDYAKRKNLQLQNKVLEHFLANPFNGGNELEWEAKIILPLAVH